MHTLLMISTLLLSIMRGVWFIEPDAANAYFPFVKAIMLQQGNYEKLLPAQKTNLQSLIVSASDINLVAPNYAYGLSAVTTKNSIAVIPQIGAVMKYDGVCGEPGTKTLSRWFTQAEKNTNIIGTVFLHDSPGGEASGTNLLSDLISQLNKPVVSYIEGLCASADYWLASASNEIIASSKTDIIGSIGTYLTVADWSAALEQEGIKLHEIYATKSTEKNSVWKEALNGNYEPIRKQLIDPFNESFHAGVKKNRYGKGLNAKVFAGNTYMTNDAINYGLIDAYGNFDYALQRVQKLAA